MKYLYVGMTDEVDRGAARRVAARVEAAFGGPVRELELGSVEFAHDAARGQYASIPVLEMLLRRCPEDARKLLAVTGRDLFIPVLTFVFGHAQLGGKVGVISLARLEQEFYGLAPDREVLLERADKEALHETGHMFGLVHCAERRCAMSLATNIRQIDVKDNAFCPQCAARLRKQIGEQV
ncbi:MAG TPA: archaemetzincin [Verrucomicrobiae bacterium]|nr:archaemetzincin [Verrucomicrobiae bacterium]